jgi:hypothetical protein
MVLTKIAIVAVAIAALLGLAKNQMWFERAGLLAECEVVQAPYGGQPGGQWWMCHAGALSGLPNLARDHCESKRITGQNELWRCPNAIGNPA